jgi:cytosine/adenosine deaminase-related metal-dependent hydrolase
MILRGRWVVPINSPNIEGGAVVVDQDKITDFGPALAIEQKYPAHQVRDFPKAVIMPGFVNVHTHLELTVLRGYLEDLSFWQWIQKLTRTKYQILTYDDIAVSALLGVVEGIRSGITTVADPMDLGATLDAMFVSGLRGILYQECFSPKPDEAEPVLRTLKKKIVELKGRIRNWPIGNSLLEMTMHPQLSSSDDWEQRRLRLRLGLSPHSAYTVSGSLFQKVKEYSDAEQLPLCIHAAESAAESELLERGTGPIMQSYEKRGIEWSPPRCSPIQYLDRLGVIEKSTLLIHCVRLTDSDFEILKSRNAGVAHCPKSNWKLGHGSMDLRTMHQRKVRVGLGSDSVASNNSMDFFEEIRFALFNPSCCLDQPADSRTETPTKRFSAEDALRMATLGGADALGMSATIGSIEIGKQADLIAVDLSQPHVLPVFSPITALVCSARASDVTMTMVGGEIVFDGGRVSGVNEEMLYQRIETIGEKVVNAPGQD